MPEKELRSRELNREQIHEWTTPPFVINTIFTPPETTLAIFQVQLTPPIGLNFQALQLH